MKFNVEMPSYTFCGRGVTCTGNKIGWRVAFQIAVKNKDKTSKAETPTKQGKTDSVYGLLNFAKYAARNLTSTSYTWLDTSVSTSMSGANAVIQYDFSGPFENMIYDPIVTMGAGQAATASVLTTALVVVVGLLAF
jgi:hypothetical protein